MSDLDALPPRLTVWFDGGCPLCTREISLMRRLDRSGVIDFVDVQGDGTCPLDRATLMARFHARESDGPILVGAEAFAAMWRAVPLLRPLGLAARWRPLLGVLEWIYVGFLRVRPALQRWMRRRDHAADHV
jgi:predicted DCC family thiol-disulfide oxidoreductase YuxK